MLARAALRRLAGRRRQPPLELRLPTTLLDVLRSGPAAVEPGDGGRADASVLEIALIIPQFRRGSGGHATIANLVRGLEARGHRCSLWVEDEEGRHADEPQARTAALFRAFFGPVGAPVHTSFAGWRGADLAVATGWQTVARTLLLPGVRARAYRVQDHEPEIYGTSAERLWAEWTYRQGLHCVCASPWLADVVRTRYGATASAFDLGVDHDRYQPLAVPRRDDLVLFYARTATPRRAVALGLLALTELHSRRPPVEIGLFGEPRAVQTPFPRHDLGVLEPARLARAYCSAAVGLVLSMTNPSLVPTEMLACGLPVVDLASESMRATFGDDGPVTLAAPNPLALCDAIEALLDDPDLRRRRSAVGAEHVAARTWPAAAAAVEEGLRTALRRESAA